MLREETKAFIAHITKTRGIQLRIVEP